AEGGEASGFVVTQGPAAEHEPSTGARVTPEPGQGADETIGARVVDHGQTVEDGELVIEPHAEGQLDAIGGEVAAELTAVGEVLHGGGGSGDGRLEVTTSRRAQGPSTNVEHHRPPRVPRQLLLSQHQPPAP